MAGRRSSSTDGQGRPATASSAFLELTSSGWRLSAAGCTPRAGRRARTTARSRPDARDVRPVPRGDRRRAGLLHGARAVGAVIRSATTGSASRSRVLFLGTLVGQALRRPRRLQRRPGRPQRRHDLALALRPLVGVRRRRARELAVGVPAVHALHPRHRVAAPARLAGVQGARRGRAPSPTPTRRSASTPRPTRPRWARAGGWRTLLYSNSLLLVMGAIWLASWLGQSITGRVAYNAERFDHQQAAVTWWQYLAHARTSGTGRCRTGSRSSSRSARWSCSSIYLRQRGSPERERLSGGDTAPTGRRGTGRWRRRTAGRRRSPRSAASTTCPESS